MKKIICNFLLLLVSMIVYSQSSKDLYIMNRIYVNDGNQYIDYLHYYDTFGQPIELIQKKITPTNNDLIIFRKYDGFGREVKQWLPVSMTNVTGRISESTITNKAVSDYSDPRPFSETLYESSPLSRILKEKGPGVSWDYYDHHVCYTYDVNEAVIACFVVNESGKLERKANSFSINTLFKIITTDEDGKTIIQFKDKQERIILERKGSDSDTYFVYNNLGQLSYVLPPNAIDAMLISGVYEDTHSAVRNFAYVYKYDNSGNCCFKQLPGCDPILMKYDKGDQLVFSQDGNQRTKNEWSFYLYDELGRMVVRGSCISPPITSFENAVVKATYNGETTLGGYSVNPSLSGIIKLMEVIYYDNYSFVNALTVLEKSKMAMLTFSGYDNAFPNNTDPNGKGLITGTRIYQLVDSSKYTISAMYYDQYGRLVQKHSSNHLNGFEDEYYAYYFSGKAKQRQHVHSAAGEDTQTEMYSYTYDHAERLLSVSHKIGNAPAITLAQNTYDEVGRLKTKKLATEISTYNYNIRGWLTQIAGTNYQQTLTYDVSVNDLMPGISSYNGNISATKWKAGTETMERGYKFEYDEINRLKVATYGEGTSLIDNPNRYDEKVTLYDKMGNIENLERHGKADGTNVFGIIDNLTYAYTGNKLTKVTDSATLTTTYYGAFQFVDGANDVTEYTYDANGNLKKDYNKKIVDIAYNSLNLPDGLQFTNGNTTMYTYDATGNKLSVTHQTAVAGITIPMSSEMITLTPEQIYSSFKTDYCGNMIYENGELSKILTEEGYITFSGSTPVYHYYLRDHQGNNRVVLNQSGTVEQVNHYYPFGGLFGESTNIETQPYKYNGKEFDGMYGLNLFDYGARHYDAALGRWMVVDPLTEGYYNISPYAYVGNNPVYFIDLDGREVVISGTLSDEALRQLQDRMQNRITLTRNAESGKLSYTVNEGQKLKGYAKRMANMIDNQSITVNLITTDKNETSTGNLMVGGAFMGNTVTTDANGNKAVVANQEVNPNVLGSADTHTKTAGKMMMHEATEAYAGAQLSQKSGVSAAPATQADANNPRSVYMRAHNKATSQTPVSQTLYDRNGNVTTDVTQAVRVEWSVTRGSRSKVIQTYP
ncbi:MAG: DUF6443 domain-containing protein [Dysgonamonadaceae bacterium]|nr:DUF6443 domain-containing protein [Dysgonamonadaceae bacterium]MDD3310039.1 DUF6443 domain-containing protein [Dysgonamonadaceae bacterium]MDD4399845.1 DUF6443 domain-containing protein [Dysgonamonadaceae bacterium]